MQIIYSKSLGIYFGLYKNKSQHLFLTTRAYTRNGVIENLLRLSNLIIIK